ncbi:pectinesterase family protein [Streptomyces virginiae]|uniref:pectinesterase family protein n=1 Tax=Streptomyces virginiae TaxID=1961 RepID=UPI002E2A061A|nr:pectinesterase family protein [Streptomyces virginiae]
MTASAHRRLTGRRRLALAGAATLVAAGLGAVPLVAKADAVAPADLAHGVPAARDGWAASGSGTTGGRAADAAHVFTVSTRAELVRALAASPAGAPRIVRVKGLIDADTDDSGKPQSCADHAAGTGYSLDSYLKAYDPAVWGRAKVPSGTQENARRAAQARQAARMVFTVPARTTLIGVPGTGAGITGGSLVVKNADNVIIRNLSLTDVRDCFPQWDPTDGSTGNWNSAYDAVSLRGATHVWVDHNSFSDAPHPDSANPVRFGREYQVHDGALDITNASDLVTVGYNTFSNHDKTMLIGSSDKDTKLRVTLHHNVFRGIVQRAPLARVGQIHLYDNYYDTTASEGYAHSYSVNSRAGAQVVAQNNYWKLSSDRKISQLLSGDGTGAIAGSGNLVGGAPVDLVAAHNSADPGKKIKTTVGWRPTLTAGLEPAAGLPAKLTGRAGKAGAGVLTETGGKGPAPSAPTPSGPAGGRTLTVAADGSAAHRSVQAAVDAASAGDTVLVSRGTYRETVNVPASKHGLTLKGATGNAEDVVITYDNASGTPKPGGGTYGTAGSATATFSANDITVTGVTVENTWERSAHPDVRDTQAVAVNASGDRQKYLNSRFIGHQDTVLNWAPTATGQYRQYFRHCFIAGDVDFVFGNATAVYDHVNITLRDRGAAAGGLGGYLAAPNTDAAKPYGILITDSTISSPARPGTYYLGRPWHPGASAVGQLVIRNTSLPAAVKTEGPWTDMGGFSWKSARFAEYANTGPGAGTGANRPQLAPDRAAAHTARAYLAGTDGWNPTD